MIRDEETNFVFISDLLKENFPQFHNDLVKIFEKNKVAFDYLKNTKDPWCRDYMPVQLDEGKFISFDFNPEYLQGAMFRDTITRPDEVLKSLRYSPTKLDLRNDGGNWICCRGLGLLTDKILKDNRQFNKDTIVSMLKKALCLDDILILPKQPYDLTGHIDEMGYLLDRDTILLADFSRESKSYQKKLFSSIKNLKVVNVPTGYSAEKNDLGDYTAIGCYINFLRVGNLIVMPTYGMSEDNGALTFFKSIFADCRVETIESSIPARSGGSVHCLTWNIKTSTENQILGELCLL